MAADQQIPGNPPSIWINQVPIQWSDARDRFTFFGIEGIIFWKAPSLLSLLQPLRDELGEELYGLLIAHEAARGTYDDYYAMVASLGSGFEEGFANWGRAVSGAGWGRFELLAIDWEAARATVCVARPWELTLFPGGDPANATPFLNGKLSGIFSWAFQRHCRARVEDIDPSADGHVTLSIAPSDMTLEDELEQLRSRRGLNEREYLQVVNRELRAHLERFYSVVEATGEFVVELDRQFRVVFATPTLAATLGCGGDELKGRDFRSLLSAEGHAAITRWLAEQPRRPVAELEVSVPTAQGELRWLSLGMSTVPDLRGAATGYRVAGRDVTAARRAQQELRLMATTFRSSQAVAITDPSGRVERVNAGFEQISGRAAADVVGLRLQSLGTDRPTCERLEAAVDAAQRDGTWEGEVGYRGANEETCPVWQSVTACRDDDGVLQHFVAVFHDISRQKQLERQLEWQATHDHLTGLANRSLLERSARRAIAQAHRHERPLSLLLIDADRFKRINDRFGHDAGDAVLRGLAERLEGALRQGDLLARWGGEEFMLLAPETAAGQALELAERLCRLVREAPMGEPGTVTVSIGLSALQPSDSFESLFRRTDQALYAAKSAGRDCCRSAAAPWPSPG